MDAWVASISLAFVNNGALNIGCICPFELVVSKSFSNEDSSPCLRLGDYRFLLMVCPQENICSLFVFCYMISEGRVADAGAGEGQLGSEGILQYSSILFKYSIKYGKYSFYLNTAVLQYIVQRYFT